LRGFPVLNRHLSRPRQTAHQNTPAGATHRSRSEPGEDLLAHRLVALGALGVVADDEAVAGDAVVDPDLLDAQVALNDVVAALTGERRLRLLGVGAELRADDLVPAGALQVSGGCGRW